MVSWLSASSYLKMLLHRSPRESRAKSGMFAGLFQVAWATKEKAQREDSDSVQQGLTFPPGHHQREDAIALVMLTAISHFPSNS